MANAQSVHAPACGGLVLAGRGAYGTVWKAYDKVLLQHVAIKVIPLLDTDREELQAIQREIQFLAGCNHPNIVKYLVSPFA